MMFRKKPFGFTVLELLIAIAVVAILLSVAVPNYYDYKRNIEFSYVVGTANQYKNQVERCAFQNKGLNACNGNTSNIQINQSKLADGYVKSLVITSGVIRATASQQSSLNSETYILTPNYQNQRVTWTASGSACKAGLVNCHQ